MDSPSHAAIRKRRSILPRWSTPQSPTLQDINQENAPVSGTNTMDQLSKYIKEIDAEKANWLEYETSLKTKYMEIKKKRTALKSGLSRLTIGDNTVQYLPEEKKQFLEEVRKLRDEDQAHIISHKNTAINISLLQDAIIQQKKQLLNIIDVKNELMQPLHQKILCNPSL